jgi:predicted dehydrogenase
MSQKQSTVSRRTFLSNAAVIGASGTLGAGSLFTSCSGGNNEKLTPLRPVGEYYVPDLTDKAIDGKPLKAALIGCGSRGAGAAMDFINAGDGLSVVACADIFGDRMDRCRRRLRERANNDIPDDRSFLGFDAYKKACELPDVDVILIATPTIFHPEHVKYAIDNGKHVFCEKPACIDAVGYRTFMMAVRQAQTKGLCLVTGTQRHHNRGYVESYKKVQEGYIGRITSANVYWNQGHFNFARRRPEWSDMEYMLRDFFSWNWLCGDHVIDQLVHNVDVFTWFSHLKPVRVIGMGSQLRRLTGDIYDNFSADIEYEGGVHVHAMARQIDNCDNRVAEIIQGTKGSWSSQGFIIRDLDGNVVWQYDDAAAKEQFKQHNDYVLEHIDLVNHIRSGKVVNQAETTAIASLACVMARESAYTGKAYTWDEMSQSDLSLMPAELHLGNVDMSKYVPPLPGTSPTY